MASESVNEKEAKQLIQEGWIFATAIIEIAGMPKEHVENTLKGVVEQIRESKSIKVKKTDFVEAEEKDSIFFVFVELDMLFKDINTLTGFCFDYMPSSIELIEPEKLSLPAESVSDFLNDICTRLHKSDAIVKNLNIENDFVQKNISAVLQNLVIMSLRFNDKSFDELSNDCGMKPEHLMPVIRVLMKQEIVQFDGRVVSLNPRFRKEQQNYLIERKDDTENKN